MSRVISIQAGSISCSGQTIELTPSVIQRAMSVAETHGLRGYDAVQLAAALEVNAIARNSGLTSIIFVSADNELNAIATSEGLAVENPNLYP